MTGTVVADRYRVERLIGQGGMGSVWEGRHLTLDRHVAIKFVHPKYVSSRDALRRFDVEARAAARIRSRHAVEVYDHGAMPDGQPYIVMEYLEGRSLEAAIREQGALPMPEVTQIVVQAARALEAAHMAGVVHRDLKPDNILLATDPESDSGFTVKLVDFGIAKLADKERVSGITKAGEVLGTPQYMSPESLTNSAPVSAASDIWSLGACAFDAACGQTPFDGAAIGEVALKVCSAPMPVPSRINPHVPKAFDLWFAKACAREPEERFPSARDMAEALEQLDAWLLSQQENEAFEIRARQASELELELQRPPRTSGRALVLAGALVGIALTVAGMGYYVQKRTREANEAMQRTAASANAVIRAENQRKLDEARRLSGDAGVGDAETR